MILYLFFKVHRVLEDGIAARAGIKRGSKVTSINGNSMSGLTHAQSVTILKVLYFFSYDKSIAIFK